MSYANGTTHYNLPQTVGTDKRDWFDTNSAFADVDAALYAAATGQAADAEAISTLQGTVSGMGTDITNLQTTTGNHTNQIGALQTSVGGLVNTVADVRQDAEDMISAYNEGAAETSTHAYAIGDYFIYNDVLYKATAAIAIGDTIVPNTNCQATNVTTQIKALESVTDKVGDLTTLTTTDKSSAVAAINEVNTTAGSAAAAVGTLSSLTTTDKTSAVAAINEVNNDLAQVEDVIPSTASSSNKLVTTNDITGVTKLSDAYATAINTTEVSMLMGDNLSNYSLITVVFGRTEAGRRSHMFTVPVEVIKAVKDNTDPFVTMYEYHDSQNTPHLCEARYIDDTHIGVKSGTSSSSMYLSEIYGAK